MRSAQPARSPSAQQAQRRRPQQQRPQVQKEQRLKSGQSEDSLNAEPTHAEAQKVAEETGAHNMEQLSHALAHAEQDQAKEAKEAHAENREQAEKEDKPSGFFSRVFGKAPSQKQPSKDASKNPPQLAKQQSGLQQAQKRPTKDGFEKNDVKTNALTSGSYASLNAVTTTAAVKQVQAKLMGQATRSDRPPDAFSVLKEAKDRGVLFQEDWEREGHSEDQDDPELAAAVEEVIQRLFGKSGILRVGPGHNEAQEAVVVVVATQGFTQASLEAIPEKAGRFPTMLALSFELLPLRRDR